MSIFNKKPTTLEEVKKAYENLSDEDKKAFHQSIAECIHESVGEQEHDSGETDSQSAEAREHEALGEEHAEGDGDVAELHESDDTPEEKSEDAEKEQAEEHSLEDSRKSDENRDEIIAQLSDRIGTLEQSLKEFGELKERMEDYTRKQAESFGLNGHAVGGKKDFDAMSADELKSAILSGNQ